LLAHFFSARAMASPRPGYLDKQKRACVYVRARAYVTVNVCGCERERREGNRIKREGDK